MTRDKIDQLWAIALKQALDAGEPVFMYHFTALVLEEAARLVTDTAEWKSKGWTSTICPITKEAIAQAIRAMKPEVKT
jgi:hypothetical protein